MDPISNDLPEPNCRVATNRMAIKMSDAVFAAMARSCFFCFFLS